MSDSDSVPKPAETLRFASKDPTGKRRVRVISLLRYTREQAFQMGERWKKEIAEGKHLPPEPTTTDKNFSIPRKPFTSLEMPSEGGASALFLGQTRSGKTTFIKEFHKHFFRKHITILHTCSPNAHIYKDYKKSSAISPEFGSDTIEECMLINQKTNMEYDFLHIIDDCVSSKNDKTMIRLLTIGRNSAQSVLISGQELSILNAIGRTNLNFIFLGRLTSSRAVEKVVKEYLLGIFPTKMALGDKIKLYRELTSEYNWICINALTGDIFITKLLV